MLGILRTVQCIGCSNDGFGKFGRCARAEILSNGNERNAVLLDLALVNEITSGIAEEARLAVNQNYIIGRGLHTGGFYQALKFGPFVVSGAGTGIDEFAYHYPATSVTIAPGLAQLVGNRYIVLSLPSRRDTRINRDTLGHFDSSFEGWIPLHPNRPTTPPQLQSRLAQPVNLLE